MAVGRKRREARSGSGRLAAPWLPQEKPAPPLDKDRVLLVLTGETGPSWEARQGKPGPVFPLLLQIHPMSHSLPSCTQSCHNLPMEINKVTATSISLQLQQGS